jgi:hypothetical protein
MCGNSTITGSHNKRMMIIRGGGKEWLSGESTEDITPE